MIHGPKTEINIAIMGKRKPTPTKTIDTDVNASHSAAATQTQNVPRSKRSKPGVTIEVRVYYKLYNYNIPQWV